MRTGTRKLNVSDYLSKNPIVPVYRFTVSGDEYAQVREWCCEYLVTNWSINNMHGKANVTIYNRSGEELDKVKVMATLRWS